MKRFDCALVGALVGICALAGCGDDSPSNDDPDAAVDPDAEEPDPDAAPPLPDPTPNVTPLSTTAADGFNAVAFAPDGSFYAAGYLNATATDRAMVVAKYTAAGQLDTEFGDEGHVMVNMAEGGGGAEAARAIVVQSTGNIVVAGIIEADVTATGEPAKDRDVALFRLTPAGELDDTFDGDGKLILNWATGLLNGAAWAGADDLRDMRLDAEGRILLHGAQLTLETDNAPRYDTDFVMMRLSADGEVDETFNAKGPVPGRHTFDLLDASASVRTLLVLPSGDILGSGYANTSAFDSVQPVVYRLSDEGELDTAYGTAGFFHEAVLPFVTEIYGIALQGDSIVTAGYGREAEDADNDWVSLRIDGDGTLDPAWGEDGAVRVDWDGFGDNCRAITALPGDRAMLVGSGDTAAENARDARILVLERDGERDTDFFGDGELTYDLGATTDAFWNTALAPDASFAVVVGTRGVGSTQTEAANDDSVVMVIPLE